MFLFDTKTNGENKYNDNKKTNAINDIIVPKGFFLLKYEIKFLMSKFSILDK